MNTEPVIIVQLIHIQGPLKGRIQEFSGPAITIGRNPTCDMQFPKDLAAVSRSHAEIVREGNRFKLVDRSTNGTFVNGKQVKEVFLKDGDVIMFSPDGPKVSFLAKAIEMRDIEQNLNVTRPEPMMQVDVPVPPAGERAAPEPPKKPAPEAPGRPEEIAVRKVQVPLIVQYGPTLNSYRELPVNIGQGPGNDLIMTHPSIADRHAQIFFAQGKYWIKDLTGRKSISINGRPIDLQAALNVNDVLSLSPQGPVLRFLGEGRLAEYEEPEPAPPGPGSDAPEGSPKPPDEKKKGGWSIKDIFKR
ncbi:MAG TPA: FHA domain-containing protein [Deltaproteobacteria bacterium]|nr:FHA domain-containing protein [Deltaproteobacteria bacterium]